MEIKNCVNTNFKYCEPLFRVQLTEYSEGCFFSANATKNLKFIFDCLRNCSIVFLVFILKFRRYGGIFSLNHCKCEVSVVQDDLNKILINLRVKCLKGLEVSIV